MCQIAYIVRSEAIRTAYPVWSVKYQSVMYKVKHQGSEIVLFCFRWNIIHVPIALLRINLYAHYRPRFVSWMIPVSKMINCGVDDRGLVTGKGRNFSSST